MQFHGMAAFQFACKWNRMCNGIRSVTKAKDRKKIDWRGRNNVEKRELMAQKKTHHQTDTRLYKTVKNISLVFSL